MAKSNLVATSGETTRKARKYDDEPSTAFGRRPDGRKLSILGDYTTSNLEALNDTGFDLPASLPAPATSNLKKSLKYTPGSRE